MGYFSAVLAEPAAKTAVSSLGAADFLRVVQPNPLVRRGSIALNELASLTGYSGSPVTAAWRQVAADAALQGGNAESGNHYSPLDGVPEYDPAFVAALEGYTFTPTSDTERRGYQITGPDGRSRVINWGDKESGFDKFVSKAIPIGLGALGVGAALGAFGAGAGASSGFTAGAVDSAALGLDTAAGATTAGGGTVGGGLTLGGSAGYGSIAAPSAALGAGGAGLSSGAGLTAPVFAGGGTGIAGGLGMTAGAGAGTVAAGAGGITSLLSGLGSASGIRDLASLASGIYGLKLAGDAREASDPFAQYRGVYGAQLAALEANPGSIVSRPGFQAGLETIGRKSAASGYYGSGNMAAALSRYSGDFYNQEAQRLAGLAGAGQTPGAGQALGADLASRSLGSIGYGLAPMLERFVRGG